MQPNIIQPQGQTPTPTPAPGLSPNSWFQSEVPVPPQPAVGNFAPATPLPESKTANKARLTVIGLAVAVALFGAGFLTNGQITAMSKSSATKQAQSFITALNSGNNAKAYALTSASLQKEQSQSQFANSLGDLSASNPNFQNGSIAFSGRTATYRVTENDLPPDASGNTNGQFTVLLVKSGVAGWKVDNVQVN